MKKTFKYIPSAALIASFITAATLSVTASAGEPSSVLATSNFVFQEQTAEERRCALRKKKKKRNTQSMTQAFYKKYEKANELIAEKLLDEAEIVLDKVLNGRKINDYERTVAWQAKANIAFERNNHPGAIKALEKVISLRHAIRELQELQILYSLAQLYYSEDNIPKTLRFLQEWEPKAKEACVPPNASQLMFISQIHYNQEDYRSTLSYLNRAIDLANANPEIEVKERWYTLAVAAHWELKEYSNARDFLEILVIQFPKRQYWLQLSQAYFELGDETAAYSLMEGIYKMGMLNDKPAQLVNVASMLFAQEVPVKAAWVLEAALKADQLDPKRNANNQKLLGQAWMMSQEFDKALSPLSISAAESADAKLWFQIAQVQMQLDRSQDVIKSCDSAITILDKNKKSNKKDTRLKLTLLMMKGTAFTAMEDFKDARKAFRGANKLAVTKKDKNAVKRWLKYVKAEEGRVKMLNG